MSGKGSPIVFFPIWFHKMWYNRSKWSTKNTTLKLLIHRALWENFSCLYFLDFYLPFRITQNEIATFIAKHIASDLETSGMLRDYQTACETTKFLGIYYINEVFHLKHLETVEKIEPRNMRRYFESLDEIFKRLLNLLAMSIKGCLYLN